MRPKDLQTIGEELAIQWDNGEETYIPLTDLRRACPCAGCKGEVDVMGNLSKGPEKPFNAGSFTLRGMGRVGTYAIQPAWADGHATGIYSFEYLKRLGDSLKNRQAGG
jgi:DUF971 family protein